MLSLFLGGRKSKSEGWGRMVQATAEHPCFGLYQQIWGKECAIGPCRTSGLSSTFLGPDRPVFGGFRITRQSGGMADALDSKSSARKGVWVRVPPLVFGLKL